MEVIGLKAGVRVQFSGGPVFSTYHECNNDAEEAEAEGGHEESHVLILLLHQAEHYVALRFALARPYSLCSAGVRGISCESHHLCRKIFDFRFFLQSEFGDAKLISFFDDLEG